MKKNYFIVLLCTFCFFGLSAQVLFSENFENGGLPTGWENQSMASDGGWRIGTEAELSSQFFGISSNGSVRFAATNDDGCNCNKSNDLLRSPAIDLTGQNNVVLSFDAFYTDQLYAGAQEHATIEISTDGTNWEIINDLPGASEWSTHRIDISSYAGQTVFIGFRYGDSGGWVFGFAIDNIAVEVPLTLDADLVKVNSRAFGEINRPFDIAGSVVNIGISEITSLEMSYSVNGEAVGNQVFSNISLPSFQTFDFQFSEKWIPSDLGATEVKIEILNVNGQQDEIVGNNAMTFETEIFNEVIVPNKIMDFVDAVPVVTEIPEVSNFLNGPTDLDFHPILGKNELWVINQRTESDGGSTMTISDATSEFRTYRTDIDGNSWHFMSLPTAIAFSDDNFNFASSAGVLDANHSGGTFTGPTLWSSDPEIYAQPSGGNGSHLDMLHGSPFSMGIAHEKDNAFWVYDNYNKDIVRYDFHADHGPGNDDHSDGTVQRYPNIGINGDGDIPNHMILDKATGWLYFVDNGNDRVMRLDINSASGFNILQPINEPLAEHLDMNGFTREEIISEGLERPCGIELIENYLLVGDYANGDINVYDMNNNFALMGKIPTGNQGLTGIKVGPEGNIWVTNRILNSLYVLSPGMISATDDFEDNANILITPNPALNQVKIKLENVDCGASFKLEIFNAVGQKMYSNFNQTNCSQIDVSNYSSGNYFLNINSTDFSTRKKLVIQN